jgi:hypothetical protein
MSSPPDTPLAPTRWAAMFEKQAESTVGDYDMLFQEGGPCSVLMVELRGCACRHQQQQQRG